MTHFLKHCPPLFRCRLCDFGGFAAGRITAHASLAHPGQRPDVDVPETQASPAAPAAPPVTRRPRVPADVAAATVAAFPPDSTCCFAPGVLACTIPGCMEQAPSRDMLAHFKDHVQRKQDELGFVAKNARTAGSNLSQHAIKSHAPAFYKCPFCDRRDSAIDRIALHARQAHGVLRDEFRRYREGGTAAEPAAAAELAVAAASSARPPSTASTSTRPPSAAAPRAPAPTATHAPIPDLAFLAASTHTLVPLALRANLAAAVPASYAPSTQIQAYEREMRAAVASGAPRLDHAWIPEPARSLGHALDLYMTDTGELLLARAVDRVWRFDQPPTATEQVAYPLVPWNQRVDPAVRAHTERARFQHPAPDPQLVRAYQPIDPADYAYYVVRAATPVRAPLDRLLRAREDGKPVLLETPPLVAVPSANGGEAAALWMAFKRRVVLEILHDLQFRNRDVKAVVD
ncbi:hypothetical protein H9P43_006960 [Blastocladiella emersonii ATCC 22665]|nr:hypothetical protein H9P43_006960 [Blastocladiella emersonii ATCC 22665]